MRNMQKSVCERQKQILPKLMATKNKRGKQVNKNVHIDN